MRTAKYVSASDASPNLSATCTNRYAQHRYMAGYKCNVTGSTSSKKVATAQVAKYCEDNNDGCVKGAKQMIAFNRKISRSRNLVHIIND